MSELEKAEYTKIFIPQHNCFGYEKELEYSITNTVDGSDGTFEFLKMLYKHMPDWYSNMKKSSLEKEEYEILEMMKKIEGK